MMILRILALLLAFIITMPIALTAFTELGNAGHQIEFCDNLPEEEREERETEKDRERDSVEEYTLRRHNQMATLGSGNSKYSSANNILASVKGDVLTPPPEFI